jgi:hypothetical protein
VRKSEIPRKSERKIVRALEDPETARRFAEDPARALQQIDVKVPTLLKGHLVVHEPPESMLQDDISYLLGESAYLGPAP